MLVPSTRRSASMLLEMCPAVEELPRQVNRGKSATRRQQDRTRLRGTWYSCRRRRRSLLHTYSHRLQTILQRRRSALDKTSVYARQGSSTALDTASMCFHLLADSRLPSGNPERRARSVRSARRVIFGRHGVQGPKRRRAAVDTALTAVPWLLF